MKVFHHGSYQQTDVPSSSAVEHSVEQTLRLFAGLREEGSCIGIELDDRHVMQMRREDGALRTEILDKASRTIEHCILSWPLAEEVICAAFSGSDFRRVTQESFIQWQHENL